MSTFKTHSFIAMKQYGQKYPHSPAPNYSPVITAVMVTLLSAPMSTQVYSLFSTTCYCQLRCGKLNGKLTVTLQRMAQTPANNGITLQQVFQTVMDGWQILADFSHQARCFRIRGLTTVMCLLGGACALG